VLFGVQSLRREFFMPLYRAYFFNQNGRIVGVHSIDRDGDDDDAISAARLLLNETSFLSIEVWNLGRRIASLERERE
jgi:hypothetical protein